MPKFNMLVSKSYHYSPTEDIVIEAADAEEAEAKVLVMSDRGDIEWEEWWNRGTEDQISIEAEEIEMEGEDNESA